MKKKQGKNKKNKNMITEVASNLGSLPFSKSTLKVTPVMIDEVSRAPLGSDEFGKYIREAYMDTVKEVVVLSEDLEEILIKHDEIIDEINKLRCEKEIIEHTIMSQMKNNETAYVKNRKITWKKSVRSSIDTKRLKDEEPEIYEKYSKTSSSRLFKIK